jgi:RHS repeat-associated protein
MPASMADSDVGATTYVYDGLRRLVGVQHPDGAAEGWGLDALDRVTATTNAAGGVTTFEYDANGNLARRVDPLGYETTLQVDAMDRPTNRMDSLGARAATTYDVMGRPVAVADPAGTNLFRRDKRGWTTNVVRGARTWTQHQDPEGNVTNLVSPGGSTNRYAYNWIGWLTHRYDPLYGTAHFQTVRWVYDYRGNVVRFTNQMGEATSYGWDKANRLIVVTNPVLGRATAEYDAAGNRTRQTDFDGNAATFGYTPMGRLAAVTNALGETTRVEYDVAGRPARTIFADGARKETAYDAAGRAAVLTDEGTNAWRLAYDARGEVVAVTNPAGGATTYAYNLDGTLQSVADADVGPVSHRYDAARRLVETVWSDGSRVQFDYDEHDDVVGLTDARGMTTTFEYDADGQLVAAMDPASNVTAYAYDAAGRPTNVVDRAGGATAFEYDLAGRLTAATDATGMRAAFGRDKLGQITNLTVGTSSWSIVRNRSGFATEVQTPLARRTSFGLDALQRVARITNALGETSAITHDARGRVTAVADPAGRVTQTAYDPRGLPAAIVLPDSNAVAYAWNSIGRLEELADLHGAAWDFTYTPMGRLQTITDPLFRATHYGYDARGLLASVAYPDGGTATFTRDANGAVVRLQYSGGPDLPYSRDELGRVTNAGDVALAYDPEGRILSATATGTAFGATYDPAGRLATASYANGAFAVTYAYSIGAAGNGTLTRVSDSLTGTQIDFAYDADLRLRTATLPNGEIITTTWDDADRLTRLQSGAYVDVALTYDASERVTDTDVVAPLTPSGHLATAIAALTYDAASQISSPGYAHDARGRVTATPERTFAWDGASRLTSIVPSTTNHQPSTLAYDGLGHLRTRAAGADTNRLFCNPAIAGAPIVAEQDAATSQMRRYYVWSPGGRLLYMIDAASGNVVYFYHFDPTGNTLALTDTNRAVVAAYAYDPYGRILAQTGPVTQPFTFSGAWGVRQDGDSGTLYQMRARWYDATLGRFLSPEPLWPLLGTPKALNPYQYAGGDPIRFADPSGMNPFVFAALLNDEAAKAWADACWKALVAFAHQAYDQAGVIGMVQAMRERFGLFRDLNQMDEMEKGAFHLLLQAVQRRQMEQFRQRKAQLPAQQPAPCHARPFDSQPQRPPDPAQEIAAQLGRVPALNRQIVGYQPGAAQPSAPPAAHPVDKTAGDLATEIFSPTALWNARLEWQLAHPGQRLPGPLYDRPLPAGPQAGLPPPEPLTELGADDLATEIFFGPRALWTAALPPTAAAPAPRRYGIPADAHEPIRRADAPLPNPGGILDWMLGPEALLDYARSAASPPPPAPDRFQGRNYPDLKRARNDAFSRVAARLQAGDMAGAREAMDALSQAEQDVADYGRLNPFAPLFDQ